MSKEGIPKINDKGNILGCFVSGGSAHFEDSQEIKDLANSQGRLFVTYIFGEKGISGKLKKLQNKDYGKDMMLILFQFYVKPIPYLLQNLKEIERYRPSEKSIGIPIIITDENFFDKSENDRYSFLTRAIFEKLDLLDKIVKKKKFDTNMEMLKSDLRRILADFSVN
jgi:hypothetical protein